MRAALLRQDNLRREKRRLAEQTNCSWTIEVSHIYQRTARYRPYSRPRGTCTCWSPSTTCPPPTRWTVRGPTSRWRGRGMGSRLGGAATESRREAPDLTSSSPGTRSGSPSTTTARMGRTCRLGLTRMLKVERELSSSGLGK